LLELRDFFSWSRTLRSSASAGIVAVVLDMLIVCEASGDADMSVDEGVDDISAVCGCSMEIVAG
jgi:hypothetical protein